MSGKTGLFILLFVLLAIMIGGIVLYVIFNKAYNDIVNNEGALCITGACKYRTSACDHYPFKIADGKTNCKAAIFNDTLPVVTPT
jgi:hypothetical protein